MTPSRPASGAVADGPRFRSQRPEPARLWIAHRPVSWPGPEGPWLDLAAGRLGGARPDAALAGEPRGLDRPDDLVYLPPVEPARREERNRLAQRLARRGAPLLVQLAPGDAPPLAPDEARPDGPAAGPAAAPAIVVWDLLAALLSGDLAPLAALPRGGTVIWGLVAGITDRPAIVGAGLDRLARAGAVRVVPVVPELEPRQKRDLADGDDEAFARLFHGTPPEPRELARAAAAMGLASRFDRPPAPAGTPRAGNRRVAARLAQIADLWLRIGRPEGEAQELYRAARRVEESPHDLAALVREGNLGVLDWLGERARRQVEDCLAERVPPLLVELEAEYLGSTGEKEQR